MSDTSYTLFTSGGTINKTVFNKIWKPTLSKLAEHEIRKLTDYTTTGIIKKTNGPVDPWMDRIVTSEYGGLGMLQEMYDETPYINDNIWKGPEKTTVFKTFGLSTQLSQETLEDDKLNLPAMITKSFASSAVKTINKQLGEFFDYAFGTSKYCAPDGVALCSTSHKDANGGTSRSNRLATDSDLSEAILNDILKVFANNVDPRNIPDPIPVDNLILLIHPNNWATAAKLLYPSMVEKYAPTGPVDSGGVPQVLSIGAKWTIVQCPYLTDDDAFFVINPNEIKYEFRTRVAPKQWQATTDDERQVKMGIRGRWAFHIEDWEGIVGTPGVTPTP